MENKIQSLEDEIMELRHEVNHAVQDIQNLQSENSELQEREQVMAIIELKKENKQLQNRVRELSTSAACDHSPVTRGKSYKSEGEYSDSYRRKLKRDRTESCSRSLSWLESQGYVPTMVTVVNIKSGEETIDLPNTELN